MPRATRKLNICTTTRESPTSHKADPAQPKSNKQTSKQRASPGMIIGHGSIKSEFQKKITCIFIPEVFAFTILEYLVSVTLACITMYI